MILFVIIFFEGYSNQEMQYILWNNHGIKIRLIGKHRGGADREGGAKRAEGIKGLSGGSAWDYTCSSFIETIVVVNMKINMQWNNAVWLEEEEHFVSYPYYTRFPANPHLGSNGQIWSLNVVTAGEFSGLHLLCTNIVWHIKLPSSDDAIFAQKKNRDSAMTRWCDYAMTIARWCDDAIAMARWCDGDDAIEHRAIAIAPSRCCHRAIVLSSFAPSSSRHRTIAPSRHRAIASSSSRHRHRTIAPSHHRPTSRWYEGAIVKCMALSGFHSLEYTSLLRISTHKNTIKQFLFISQFKQKRLHAIRTIRPQPFIQAR